MSIRGIRGINGWLPTNENGDHASKEVAFADRDETQLDISSLPAGIYFVQLNTAGRSTVMKLVKR